MCLCSAKTFPASLFCLEFDLVLANVLAALLILGPE